MSSKYRTTLNVKRLTEFRHDLHMHPELKFMEHRTSDKIAAFLTELDIPYKRGLALILCRSPALLCRIYRL